MSEPRVTGLAPLLIELGTEELPVKALPGLAQAFFDGVVAALGKRGVAVQTGDGDGVNRHDTNLLFAAGGGRRPHINSSAAGDAAQILYRKLRKCQPTYRQGRTQLGGEFHGEKRGAV